MARLFRVILPVGDIEAAARFYAALLGQAGVRVSSGRHYFDCGGVVAACYDAVADGDGAAVGANPEHVYFSVADLRAMLAVARTLGCRQLDREIVRQPWGEVSFYAQDPWGNPLCFVEAGTEFTGNK